MNKEKIKEHLEDAIITFAGGVKDSMDEANYRKYAVPQIERAIAALLETTNNDEMKTATVFSKYWNIPKSRAMGFVEEYKERLKNGQIGK